MNGLPTLTRAARRLERDGRPAVLATIVSTEGSSYRKAGARMLLHDDDGMTGILGGGCFEGDLLEQARRVFRDGTPAQVRYDMRTQEDAIWGLGLGCNGAVDIFLQRIDAEHHYQPIPLIEELLRTGGKLYTVIASEHADPAPGHSWADPGCAPACIPQHADWSAGVHAVNTPGGRVSLYVDAIHRPTHLLICGAGPDAVPLSRIALMLGWEVTITDHRSAYADPSRFDRQARVLCFESELDPQSRDADAAIVMSHNFLVDARYLRALADCQHRYLGVLGPPARRQALLDEIGEVGAALERRLHGPIGLDLGGELPEEIALSVLAEIQATLHARTPAALSEPALG